MVKIETLETMVVQEKNLGNCDIIIDYTLPNAYQIVSKARKIGYFVIYHNGKPGQVEMTVNGIKYNGTKEIEKMLDNQKN